MTITINLPDDTVNGFSFEWEGDFFIKVEKETDRTEISANKAGLISLAKQFLLLAQDIFPAGYHLHYDESNSLEQGSSHLIINKV